MCLIQLQYSREKFAISDFINGINSQSSRGSSPIKLYLKSNIDDSKPLLLNINDTKLNSIKNTSFCIAHGRMTTIDNNPNCDQPLFSGCGNYIISFNGTIYNYVEIRDELKSLGVTFISNGDTEVLLQSFVQWGSKGIKKLNGQFTFVIYDLKKELLHLSSDILGQNTLFYFLNNETFVVASEYKAIFNMLPKMIKKIELDFLSSYLFNHHCPRQVKGKTFYKNIKMLIPGEWLTFDLKNYSMKSFSNETVNEYISIKPNIKDLENDLCLASKYVLTSDQKIGIQLSGGIDSTLQSYLASKEILNSNKNISFYTAKINEDSKDYKYSKNLAKKLDIPLKVVDVPHDNQALENFEELIKTVEIPMYLGGPSASSFFLAKKMSEDGIKIAISGTGGDELFCGYDKFYKDGLYLSNIYKFNFFEALKLKQLYKNRIKSLNSIFVEGLKEIISQSQMISDIYIKNIKIPFLKRKYYLQYEDTSRILSKILKDDFSRLGYSSNKGIFRTQKKDILSGAIPTWLHLNDRINMSYTLESRSLFLNKLLLKYVGLKHEEKVQNGLWKLPIRSLLAKYNIPEIAWRKDKVGFEWNKSKFLESNEIKILETINSSTIISRLFNLNELFKTWDRDKTNYSLRDFLLRCYSISILEKNYNLKSEL